MDRDGKQGSGGLVMEIKIFTVRIVQTIKTRNTRNVILYVRRIRRIFITRVKNKFNGNGSYNLKGS